MFKYFKVSQEERKKFFQLPKTKVLSEDRKRELTYRLLKKDKKWSYYLFSPDSSLGIKKEVIK